MFEKMKLTHKLMLVPVIGVLLLIGDLTISIFSAVSSSKLMNRIISVHAPNLENHRWILWQAEWINHHFQDVVENLDTSKLATAEGKKSELLNFIQRIKKDAVPKEREFLGQIETSFVDYYTYAKQTASEIVSGKKDRYSQQIVEDKFKNLKNILESSLDAERNNMQKYYSLARSRNGTVLIVNISVIVILALLFVLFSTVLMKKITKPLKIAIDVVEKVADGDLSIEVPDMGSSDETGLLLKAVDKMVKNQRELTIQIKESANSLAAAAGQISASITEIAAAATETATAATETSTTVEEVRQTATESNRKAKEVSESAEKAVQISQTGEMAVTKTIEEMQRIEEQMSSIAESIMNLSEQSQAIGEIMSTVEDIAEQSRLLAVNASIEAVKAGEYGKGFVVVAEEVRSLAEQSKEATTKVKSILEDIQKSTSEAVMKTEQGSKAVDAGVKQSAESGESIKRLAESIAQASQATTQISVSSQEQLVGMDQVASAMESIKQASTQNVKATKEVESASHSLNELGQRLKELIDQYRI